MAKGKAKAKAKPDGVPAFAGRRKPSTTPAMWRWEAVSDTWNRCPSAIGHVDSSALLLCILLGLPRYLGSCGPSPKSQMLRSRGCQWRV